MTQPESPKPTTGDDQHGELPPVAPVHDESDDQETDDNALRKAADPHSQSLRKRELRVRADARVRRSSRGEVIVMTDNLGMKGCCRDAACMVCHHSQGNILRIGNLSYSWHH